MLIFRLILLFGGDQRSIYFPKMHTLLQFIQSGVEICFQMWGKEVPVHKSKIEVHTLHKLHSVGSWGLLEGPSGFLAVPGFYNIFNAKYHLNLFYFNTFFLKMLNYWKKVTWANPPPPLKSGGPRGQSPRTSTGLQHFQCKYRQILFYFIS